MSCYLVPHFPLDLHEIEVEVEVEQVANGKDPRCHEDQEALRQLLVDEEC
jgi:hypothetical protein